MDSLNDTSWDIVIAGTGIQSSLLALSLSRSGKKVLHIDKNEYYGDSETALGIEEIQKLAEVTNGSISNVIIAKQDVETRTRLASTRPYNLSLSPHIFYTRSHLLPTLVSSKAHDQLEFLAVGNWFVYQNKNHDSTEDRTWRLVRVPNTREDIFSDTSLSMRTKGALVKLIRFVMDFESESNREKWNPAQDKSFAEFAKEQFKIPEDALPPVIALVLDLEMEKNVTTKQALRGIHRHLTSMGVFGSGFCAVLPKYGGLSEIIQVACRAAAVGGAVYVLNKAVTAIHAAEPDSIQRLTLTLEGEDVVMTDYLIGTSNQLPMTVETGQSNLIDSTGTSRRISIVDSKLSCFFPTTPTESAPTAPSVVVIVFPSMSVTVDEKCNDHPIHLLIHNGDTAECPNDQCVIYASMIGQSNIHSQFLEHAVERVLSFAGGQDVEKVKVLWSMSFTLNSSVTDPCVQPSAEMPGVYTFYRGNNETVFNDKIIDSVRDMWNIITGPSDNKKDGDEEFMKFMDRNIQIDEND